MRIVNNLAKTLVWRVWFTNSTLKVTRLCMESHITWSSTPILVPSQPAHVSEYKYLSSASSSFKTCFLFSSILCCLSFWKFACFVHCFVFRLTHHRPDRCSSEPNRIIASFDHLCICTLRSNISPSPFLRCKFYKGTFDYDFSHAQRWCNSQSKNVTFWNLEAPFRDRFVSF